MFYFCALEATPTQPPPVWAHDFYAKRFLHFSPAWERMIFTRSDFHPPPPPPAEERKVGWKLFRMENRAPLSKNKMSF